MPLTLKIRVSGQSEDRREAQERTAGVASELMCRTRLELESHSGAGQAWRC